MKSFAEWVQTAKCFYAADHEPGAPTVEQLLEEARRLERQRIADEIDQAVNWVGSRKEREVYRQLAASLRRYQPTI